VPMFTHQLGHEDAWLDRDRYLLYEAKRPEEVEEVWQATGVHTPGADGEPVSREPERLLASKLPKVADAFASGDDGEHILSLVSEVREAVCDTAFWEEQRAFDEQCREWERAVAAFETVHGRAPVLYDLCCGEGGFSRGARAAGVQCYGFDSKERWGRRYSYDYGVKGSTAVPSGMTFTVRDITDESFWEELAERGCIGNLPRPDVIHSSPPCSHDSRLGGLSAPGKRVIDFNWLISKLKATETAFKEKHGLPLVWQLENVPESEAVVTEEVTSKARLCGTMMGHRVFRHRVFYCNFDADDKYSTSSKSIMRTHPNFDTDCMAQWSMALL
jgi:hypothetical protein